MTTPLSSGALGELHDGIVALGLDAGLVPRMAAYLELLEHWNGAFNLTAVRDVRQMVSRHVLDSLAIAPHTQGLADLADLGTGAGLPGIPIAMVQPGTRVTLVESNGKKARFLRQAVRTLALDNVAVVEARAEATPGSGTFSAITARAMATLADILAAGGHLLAPDGRLLAMKGVRPDAEIAALPAPWQVTDIHRLHVPGLDGERHLVVVARSGPGARAAPGRA